jgi:hypothetical protein
MEKQLTKKMVLVLFACVGAEDYEFYNVPVDVSEDHLDQYAWERAVDFASSYGIYPEPDFSVAENDDEDDDTEYSSDISGHWDDYDAEKHDGHTISGSPQWQEM